jgi:hypothetical protein
MPPDTRTEAQREADRAELARTCPPPTAGQVRELRELFRAAVEHLVERQLCRSADGGLVRVRRAGERR